MTRLLILRITHDSQPGLARAEVLGQDGEPTKSFIGIDAADALGEIGAVLDSERAAATTYRKIIQFAPGAIVGRSNLMAEAEADLVIDCDGIVTKDRYGTRQRRATPGELAAAEVIG